MLPKNLALDYKQHKSWYTKQVKKHKCSHASDYVPMLSVSSSQFSDTNFLNDIFLNSGCTEMCLSQIDCLTLNLCFHLTDKYLIQSDSFYAKLVPLLEAQSMSQVLRHQVWYA